MERIIIVGGGILGASAAYHLAKQGTDVIVVDRQDLRTSNGCRSRNHLSLVITAKK